tara:strand:- start:802 stop:1497 length:696 start_codon:yes stop_codon:yes gene_type:complete
MANFFNRECKSDISADIFKKISKGKYVNKWYGQLMLKDPLTMGMYNALITDKKFGTIFELGSYNGSSAHWFHTLTKQYSNEAHVVSFDITNPDGIHEIFYEASYNDPHLQYVHLDANDISVPENLLELPKPWLIIEDCHVNVVGTLTYFDKYMTSGDYIVVEDTNPLGPDKPLLSDDIEYKQYGDVKLNKVKEFIIDGSLGVCNEYRVDSYYCDLYGYNSTWQWNSVLKKI